jgi:hypothetical protein
MFQLNKEEFKNLKSQFATSGWGGRRKFPFAFTEHQNRKNRFQTEWLE